MDELKFFAGLAGITLFVIGVLVYVGQKLSRAAERNAEFIGLPLYVSRTGATVFAFIVAFWVYCVAVRRLEPGSDFGRYLATSEGMAAVIFGCITVVAIAWPIFDKLGYPLATWSRDAESR